MKYKGGIVKNIWCLVDSRGGYIAAKMATDDLNLVADDWMRFILLSSLSAKEICHFANNNEYGDNCVVANQEGIIQWQWFDDNGKWKVLKEDL